ncbi:MAG: hypothetical protein ACRECE_03735 [Xanthobacteraceae bacterium]
MNVYALAGAKSHIGEHVFCQKKCFAFKSLNHLEIECAAMRRLQKRCARLCVGTPTRGENIRHRDVTLPFLAFFSVVLVAKSKMS